MGMTQIEQDVARSTLRKNNAIVKKLERIDWEHRLYEVSKVMLPIAASSVQNGEKQPWMQGKTYPEASAKLAVNYARALIAELKGAE